MLYDGLCPLTSTTYQKLPLTEDHNQGFTGLWLRYTKIEKTAIQPPETLIVPEYIEYLTQGRVNI